MRPSILIAGDLLSLLVVTSIGFATHGETNVSFLPRLAAVFLPLAGAWLLLAPWFDLAEPEVLSRSAGLWRPALVMLFAGPLAVVLRGLILEAPIAPVFAVVLTASAAAGLTVWRLACWLWTRRTAGPAPAARRPKARGRR